MISQIVVFPFGMAVKPRNIKRQSFVCSVGSIYSVSIFFEIAVENHTSHGKFQSVLVV